MAAALAVGIMAVPRLCCHLCICWLGTALGCSHHWCHSWRGVSTLWAVSDIRSSLAHCHVHSYYQAAILVVRLKIDDALDAIAVHGAAGLWGVVAEAFFNENRSILYHWVRALVIDLSLVLTR
jgi:hypothetical protein